MGEKLHGLGVGRVFRYDTKSMKLKEKLINLTSSKKKKKNVGVPVVVQRK